jgi:hypothetical protein
MGLLDKLIEVHFSTDAEGNPAFYPRSWYARARGLVISDEEAAEAIRRSMKRCYLSSLPACVLRRVFRPSHTR